MKRFVPIVLLVSLAVLLNATVVSAVGTRPGRVGGHAEGQPNIEGQVCVSYGTGTDCVSFTSFSGETSISVPGPFVQTATWSVTFPGNIAGVDDLTGTPCLNRPMPGSGMALCQHPGVSGVHRFNVTWNASASKGFIRGGSGTPG